MGRGGNTQSWIAHTRVAAASVSGRCLPRLPVILKENGRRHAAYEREFRSEREKAYGVRWVRWRVACRQSTEWDIRKWGRICDGSPSVPFRYHHGPKHLFQDAQVRFRRLGRCTYMCVKGIRTNALRRGDQTTSQSSARGRLAAAPSSAFSTFRMSCPMTAANRRFTSSTSAVLRCSCATAR